MDTKREDAGGGPDGALHEDFLVRHENAQKLKRRKEAVGDELREFLNELVEKHSDDDFDARRAVAWYSEHLGQMIRSEMEQEKKRKRLAASR